MNKHSSILVLVWFFFGVGFAFSQENLQLSVYLNREITFDGSTAYTQNLLVNRLQGIFGNQENIKLTDESASFGLIPTVTILTKDITSSAPPMISVKIDLTISFVNRTDSKTFKTTSYAMRGVGESENKAYSNAFSNLRYAKDKFTSFIRESLEMVESHYDKNCDQILSEAETYLLVSDYRGAMNILFKIPAGVEPCYTKTKQLIADAYKRKQDQECRKYISIAETALSVRDFAAATTALVRIDPESGCAQEMNELKGRLSLEVQNMYERKWELYEGIRQDKNELERERIGAMKELYSSFSTSEGKDERAANDSKNPDGEDRLVQSGNSLSLNVISPVSKRPDDKIYTNKQEINIYGFISGHSSASSLQLNKANLALDDQGIFRHSIPLKEGENKIELVLEGKDQSFQREQMNIIKVKGNDSDYQPESALVPVKDQKRYALVIGNSKYEHVAPLRNPENDAGDISSVLKELNFEVITVLNASYEEMRSSIINFSKMLPSSDVALFYFAGHGLEIEGSNYIVPVDAKISSKEDVYQYSLEVDNVLKAMKYSNDRNLNILILDACRNNPFPTGTRGGGGLARIAPPSGMIIAYATEPGATASDGDGDNGLYTGELVRQMKIPQRIEDVFMKTRNEVENKSKGGQQPWEEARLKGIFYLVQSQK